MNVDGLSKQIEELHSGVARLLQSADELLVPPQERLQIAFEKLYVALEELQVAESALQEQNAELVSAQIVAEAERQRYQDLFEFAPDGYLVTDTNAIIREANRAAAALLNTEQRFLIGKPLDVFLTEKVRRVFLIKLSQLHQAEHVQEWEVCLKPRQSEPVEVALKVAVVRNHKGQSVALRWLLRDITERQQTAAALLRAQLAEEAKAELETEISLRQEAELALTRALKEQKAVMKAIPDIVYVLDQNGNLLKWNKRLETLSGLSPEVLKGKSALTFFPATEASTVAQAIQQVFEQGKAEVEAPLVGAGGVFVPYEWSGVTLKDEAGNVIGITGVGRDITLRKQSEEALQQLNGILEHQVQERTAQLQQALNWEVIFKRITDRVRDTLDEDQILQTAVQELVLGLGLSGCNAARYNIKDSTSTICYEYVKSVPSYQHRAMQMADYPEIYNQLLNGQDFQFCSIFPNPARGHVAILACPIMNDEGVLGDLWLINSVEHAFNELEIRLVQQVASQCAIAMRQARLYQAATAQIKELEKLNQLKDVFLSTVSHELRTPLTNIKMALEMLRVIVPNSDERVGRYVEVLETECSREIDLINNLLDLQRLEDEASKCLLVDEINLSEWLSTFIEPFKVRAQQRQQIIQIHLASQLPMLVSNYASLKRILAELLSNACKYTAAGGQIVLSAEYKFVEAATVFSISNPTEIPAKELSRIFDKFYRVPNADPWKQGGTGLGLALVQRLVEQMQGTIKVESARGWTTFTVQLPNQPKV